MSDSINKNDSDACVIGEVALTILEQRRSAVRMLRFRLPIGSSRIPHVEHIIYAGKPARACGIGNARRTLGYQPPVRSC